MTHTMKQPFFSLFVLLGALLLAPMGLQAQGLEAGRVYTGQLEIAGKQVPLPPGSWVLGGVGPGRLTGSEKLGAYGTLWNLILFRPTRDQLAVDAIIELNVNELGVSDGWGLSASCTRKDFPLGVVRYKAGWDASCFFITHNLWDWEKPQTPAWERAQAFAKDKKWRLPAQSVVSGFRASNRRDVVDLRVHFLPAFYGISEPSMQAWKDSPWYFERIERDTPRINFAKSLTDWTVMFSGHVEAGLKRRLAADLALPDPGLTQEMVERDTVVQQRITSLDTLLKAGLISQATYEEQMKTLAEMGLDPSSTTPDPATIALYKTIAYRPVVSMANIFIDYYWIGQPFATGVLLLLQVTINSFKFYFHELAWEKFVSASQRRDSARKVDFAYGGIDL